MDRIYNTAKVPAYKNHTKLLSLNPDIHEIFANSNDAKELEYYWNEWRARTGQKMRNDYLVMLELSNEAARFVAS